MGFVKDGELPDILPNVTLVTELTWSANYLSHVRSVGRRRLSLHMETPVGQDRTVILNKGFGDSDAPGQLAAHLSKELSGRLAAEGVVFDWLATRLGGQWFVTVENPICGSRGQLTDHDPIDFALTLAKQTVALEAAMGRLLREG